MTLFWRRSCLSRRNRISEASTSSSSIKLDYKDYKDSLRVNKLPVGYPKALILTPSWPTQVFENINADVAWFTQKNLDQVIQAVFQAQAPKEESLFLRYKLKSKFFNIYHENTHMECYNFRQKYEDYLNIARATRPNQIPFAVFFLWDQINFR